MLYENKKVIPVPNGNRNDELDVQLHEIASLEDMNSFNLNDAVEKFHNKKNTSILKIKNEASNLITESSKEAESSSKVGTLRKIVQSKYLDRFILFSIVVNCIFLALDSPSADAKSNVELQDFLFISEIIFTTIFFFEMCLKIAVYGFIFNKGSYLRDSWNILDFFVVCSSLTAFLPENLKIPGVSALRTFRALRPLRTINRIPALRILVVTLINSIPQLNQAAVLGLFIFLLFGIVALQTEMGVLHYRCFTPREGSVCLQYSAENCIPQTELELDDLCNYYQPNSCQDEKYSCLSYTYNPINNLVSYDNIFSSVLTIFLVMILMEWGKIMYVTMQAAGNYTLVYYLVLVPISAFLFRNLLTAVVMNQFEHASKAAKEKATMDLKENYVKALTEDVIDKEIEVLNTLNTTFEGKKGSLPKKTRSNTDKELDMSSSSIDIKKEASLELLNNGKSNELNYLPQKNINLVDHFDKNLSTNGDQPKSLLKKTNKYQEGEHEENKNDESLEIIELGNASRNKKKNRWKLLIIKHADEIHEMASPFVKLRSVKDVLSLDYRLKKKKLPSFEKMESLSRANQRFSIIKKNALLDSAGADVLHRMAINRDKDRLQQTLNSALFTELPSVLESQQSDASLNSLKKMSSKKSGLNEALVPWKKNQFVRYYCWVLLESRFVRFLSIFAIVMNTIGLASEFNKQPDYWTYVLETNNFVLSIFFTIELSIKITAFPWKMFWGDPFNILDVIIVLSAFPDMISYNVTIANISTTSESTSTSSTLRIFRVFRMFRVLRVIKMVRYMESLQKIIRIIIEALPSMMWVISLIVLFQFIFAIIGMQLFGGSSDFDYFKDFSNSFWTLFVLMTETVIPEYMSKVSFYDGRMASLFFVLWECVAVFILLNLLLVIILEKFEPDQSEISDVSKKPVKEIVATEPPPGKSLFLFSPQNKFRTFIFYYTANNKLFENCIYFAVLCSCILLALDEPTLDPNSVRYIVQGNLTTFFTLFFSFELLTKMIAYGAIHYSRDVWNKLDIIVVFISILTDILPTFSALKVLRLLRALRPLRIVKRNPGLKIAILALFKSLIAIANILIFIVSLWGIFGILGMSLFSGKFYSCNDPIFPGYLEIPGDPELNGGCVGNFSIPDPLDLSVNITIAREWRNSEINFDHIGHAVLTLFQVTTLDDWSGIFDKAYAAPSNIGWQPIPQGNWPALPFFVSFIYISSLFVMKLFVGVVYNNFRLIKMQQDGSAFISPAQKKWIEAQKKVLKVSAHQEFSLPDDVLEDSIRYKSFYLYQSQTFEYFIFATIIFNILFMCLTWQTEPAIVFTISEIADWIFFFIFLIEAVVKLTALRSDYFLAKWNQFDFLLVTLGIVDKLLTLMSGVVLPTYVITILKMLRLTRISRMIRLINKVKSLKQMLMTLWWSLPSLVNILLMLILFLFMFSVVAMGIFGQCPRDNIVITELQNFESFPTSILTMFKLATGDKWASVMYALVPCLTISMVFFPLAFIFLNFFFLNLFISVILENFYDSAESGDARENDRGEETPFAKLDRQINELLDMWKLLDPKGKGIIHIKYSKYFLMSVDAPLGAKNFTGRELKAKMNLIVADHLFDKNGKICFKPFIFKLNMLAIQSITQEDIGGLSDFDEELQREATKLAAKGKYGSLLDAYSAYMIQIKWRRKRNKKFTEGGTSVLNNFLSRKKKTIKKENL